MKIVYLIPIALVTGALVGSLKTRSFNVQVTNTDLYGYISDNISKELVSYVCTPHGTTYISKAGVLTLYVDTNNQPIHCNYKEGVR